MHCSSATRRCDCALTRILASRRFAAEFGDLVAAAAHEAGIAVSFIHLPQDAAGRLAQEDCARIDVAYLSRDLRFDALYPLFCEAVVAAGHLKWVHFASAGISQYPYLAGLIERRVKLTTSAGANGIPVGETTIGAILMFARGFPRWLDAQRRRVWEPMRGEDVPRDLSHQTIVIVGLGTIGATVARFCRALGMHVIGVRRSPRQPDAPVDEMRTLGELNLVLPRADWIVLACPHTEETHHLISAKTLARLPPGAHVINVSRGGVVDERALIEALESGHLGGAYLDVFEREPLPPDSPLWGMTNVLISPHDASVASGNEKRAAEMFAANLARFARAEPMHNERHA